MARGTPSFASGSGASVLDNSQVTNIYNDLIAALTAYQNNSQDAWEEIDVVNATSNRQEIVYQSRGDRTLGPSGEGDANLIIKVQQFSDTDIYFDAYQDWSTNSSTGSRNAGGSSTRWTGIDENASYRYWYLSNEYEFVFLLKQEHVWYYVHFGSPIRRHIPSVAEGIAFTTASASSGSSVTVALDRDITASIVDSSDPNGPQRVWIYNVTPVGNALRASTVDVTTVNAITSTTITFASLANNFDSGAIVGLDPSPMFLVALSGRSTGGSLDSALYFTNTTVGTYTNVSTHTGDYENFLSPFGTPVTSPGFDGLLRGSRAGIFFDQSGFQGFRGVSEVVAFVYAGDLIDMDFWRPSYSTANQYMVFPSLSLGSAGVAAPVLAIGPGAS